MIDYFLSSVADPKAVYVYMHAQVVHLAKLLSATRGWNVTRDLGAFIMSQSHDGGLSHNPLKSRDRDMSKITQVMSDPGATEGESDGPLPRWLEVHIMQETAISSLKTPGQECRKRGLLKLI